MPPAPLMSSVVVWRRSSFEAKWSGIRASVQIQYPAGGCAPETGHLADSTLDARAQEKNTRIFHVPFGPPGFPNSLKCPTSKSLKMNPQEGATWYRNRSNIGPTSSEDRSKIVQNGSLEASWGPSGAKSGFWYAPRSILGAPEVDFGGHVGSQNR